MLSYKMDYSFCAWKPGSVKSSHIYRFIVKNVVARVLAPPAPLSEPPLTKRFCLILPKTD